MAATLVQSATPVLFSNSLAPTIVFPGNTTPGTTIILKVSWNDVNATASISLPVPADANGTWLAANNPACAYNGSFSAIGASIFYQVVSDAHTHSSTVNSFSSHAMYGSLTMEEWAGLTATPLDQISTTTNNSAASTSGGNTGTTPSLGQSNELVVANLAISCGSGLSNAGISTPASSGYSSGYVAQDTANNAGAEFSYKEAASASGQIASWTWTSDSSMHAFQASIATFKETGGSVTNTKVEEEDLVVPDSMIAMRGLARRPEDDLLLADAFIANYISGNPPPDTSTLQFSVTRRITG